MSKFIDINEAASLLSVSKYFLYQRTSRKQIPGYKLGAKLVFDPDELIDWAKRHAIEPEKTPVSAG